MTVCWIHFSLLSVALTLESPFPVFYLLLCNQLANQQQLPSSSKTDKTVAMPPATSKQDDDHPLNLFFLGNSYFGQNGLAGLCKQAFQSCDISSHVKSHHPGGETFSGHLNNLNNKKHGIHRSLLEERSDSIPWDWVLLQQQSQTPGFVHDSPQQFQQTVEHAQQIVANLQERHAQIQVLFVMTWGRRHNDKHNPNLFPDFLTMQRKITDGYLAYVAATSTPSKPTFVAPCGLVFETIHQDAVSRGEDPTKEGSLFHSLYIRDGSHPSLAGSYLCLCTILGTLVEMDVQKDLEWVPPNLDPDIAEQIREAVSRTIRETASNRIIRYPWQTVPP
ncbi:expressed unknown protein [Seminavis robusta]|uniref:DUF4886 domain-containing protein n=1 Tax=Seminavis robusta TaxID=568900 RepID=A0A9N8HNZ6_9STRA|nr:expressed unknown protein [Seminavis robusta]|eukprot:Sro1271_g258130.1 n/a (333) ;mRNA; r:25559-26557